LKKRMTEKVKQGLRFERSEMATDEAVAVFKEMNQDFKVELLNDLKTRGTTIASELNDANLVGDSVSEISLYKTGNFTDLCRGPHVTSTKEIQPGSFKLTGFRAPTGVAIRQEHKCNVYTAWHSIRRKNSPIISCALKRRRSATTAGWDRIWICFSIQPDTVGAGLILWHPKGGLIRHLAEDYCKKKHLESGYDLVYTPAHRSRDSVGNQRPSWVLRGKYVRADQNRRTGVLPQADELPVSLQHIRNGVRSYRELPMRLAEWGTVYRFEKSGVLHGLHSRARISRRTTHICSARRNRCPLKLTGCFSSVSIFCGRSDSTRLSCSSARVLQSVSAGKKTGDAAEAALEDTLKRSGIPYQLNAGDGAFYGPKIDLVVKDAIGRPWQLSTVQFDFNLPERFNLTYVGEDGAQHRPVHDSSGVAREHGAILRSIARAPWRSVAGLAESGSRR
jgi:threonyl-tRNA synthetase